VRAWFASARRALAGSAGLCARASNVIPSARSATLRTWRWRSNSPLGVDAGVTARSNDSKAHIRYQYSNAGRRFSVRPPRVFDALDAMPL
jgi:hypothetical protein